MTPLSVGLAEAGEMEMTDGAEAFQSVKVKEVSEFVAEPTTVIG